MNIDLLKIKNGIEKEIIIEKTLIMDKNNLVGTDIIRLSEINVAGKIYLDSMDDFILSVHVDGEMILPCSVTLEEVSYPFSIQIENNLLTLLQEIDENIKNIENSIDILPIIWENILMEIPMKVVSDKASSIQLEGNGWKLITDDKPLESANNEFAKLKDLFK